MSNDRKIIKKALDTNDFYETTVKIINGSLQNVEIELGGEYDVEVQVSGLTAGKIELRTKSVDFTGDDNTYDTLESTISADGTASYTGGNSYLLIVGNGSEAGVAFNLRLQVKKKIVSLNPSLFQGGFDASTEDSNPTLPTPSTANQGFWYRCDVAGTYNGDTYVIGDIVISTGSAWTYQPKVDYELDDYVKKDGSTPFTQPQKGVDGVDDNDLATVGQLAVVGDGGLTEINFTEDDRDNIYVEYFENILIANDSTIPPISGYYLNSEGIAQEGGYGDYITEFIEIQPSSKYLYGASFSGNRNICFFDSEYKLIKAISGISVGNPEEYEYVTNEDMAYFRGSVYSATGVYSIYNTPIAIKELVLAEDDPTLYDTLSPVDLYRTDNDSDSSNFYNRELIIRLTEESFVKNSKDVKLNNADEYLISKKEKNTATKEYYDETIELSTNGVVDYTKSINIVSTKSSIATYRTRKILCIGDSITALNLPTFNGDYIGGWAYPSIVKELSMKDSSDHGAPINILMVGRLNNQDNRTFDYNGSTHTVTSFSEGQGGRSVANFLRHATFISGDSNGTYSAEATWQMLGLATSEGYEYTNSVTDRNLLMNTVQTDNWDYGEAIYLDMVDSGGTYTGSAEQLLEIDNAMTVLLNNPDIPFYDLTTAKSGVGYSFNLQTYLDRYKTLDSDGVTRLVVGSTAGTLVTDANEYDVAEPNNLNIALGENDRWNFSPTAEDIVNALELIATAIHATHSGIWISFMNTRLTGSFYPSKWTHIGQFNKISEEYNEIKFDMQNLMIERWGSRSDQNTNRSSLLNTYSTISPCSTVDTRYIYDSMTNSNILKGSTDINHPGVSASTDMAYQLLSWIYYTM